MPLFNRFSTIGLRDNHWTPEEITGRWNSEKHIGANGKVFTISTPSIYKYLYSNRGQSLCKYLLSKRYTKKL